jgi:hypothetical protein
MPRYKSCTSESRHVVVCRGLFMCNVDSCNSSNDVIITGSCPDHQAVNIEWISELKILHFNIKYTRAHGYQSHFFIQFVVNIIPQGIISLSWSLSHHKLLKCEQAVLNIATHRGLKQFIFMCKSVMYINRI